MSWSETGGILSKGRRKGEEKTIIRLIPERRIVAHVGAVIAGILTALCAGPRLALPDMPALLSPLGLGCITLALISVPVLTRRRSASSGLSARFRWPTIAVGWLLAGMIAGGWQAMRLPDPVQTNAGTVDLSGVITRVDGRLDGRLWVWLAVEKIHRGASIAPGRLVRLSMTPEAPLPLAGTRLRATARIYPPPPRVLHGAPDHSRRALAAGVVASGYVISRRPAETLTPDELDWHVRLAAFRQRRADAIVAGMDRPAGGIAAALLIGDRRYVEQPVYDLFRSSGLAHLLAISGLHMGLLCFGAVGFVRGVAALATSLFSPAADGVFYARETGGHLVLAGSAGQAAVLPAATGWRAARPLSPYLADNAARAVAQPVAKLPASVTPPAPVGGGDGMRLHDHPAAGRIVIITTRRRLTAGCKAGGAMLISTVRADYPCRDGTPLVSLSGLPAGNYILRITKHGIDAVAADGQYLRISPVSRP